MHMLLRAQKANHIRAFFLPRYISLQVPEDNDEEPEGRASSEEESSDDDKSWVEEVREQRKLLRQEDRDRRRQERKDADRNTILVERERNGGEETANVAESKKTSQPQFYQIKAGEEFRSFNDMARKQKLQKYVLGNVNLLFETLFETQIASGSAAVRGGESPTCKALRVKTVTNTVISVTF